MEEIRSLAGGGADIEKGGRSMASRLVDTFCEMVRIDSESGDEARFIDYLRDLLSREFGGRCALDSYGNLIARIPAKDSQMKEAVLFGFHADTVRPGRGIEPIVEDGVIRSAGNTVLGADDKAGIAEMVEALRTSPRHPPLEIVVTREEELGLQGARHLDRSLITAKSGYVVDMDAVNAVVVGGPSKMSIDVRIKGKAAHAGMEPEKGISAIRAAAHAIVLLREGRLDEETTVNVGTIEGGEIRNGVPENALVCLECRSLSHESCLAQSELVRSAFETAARSVGASATISMDLSYRASRLAENAEPVRIAKAAIARAGAVPDVRLIGGGTDASVYNAHGIETVVIGAGIRSEHSTSEHVFVSDMETATETLSSILELLGGGSDAP